MNHCSISTDLGLLKATVREDSDYPGIDIRLECGGQYVLLAWVEVNMVTPSPQLQMRLYADLKDDEPTDSYAFTPAEVDAYFDADGSEDDSDEPDDVSEQDKAASWAGYCQYLKDWADSHSHVGFAGCCPVCYDEFLGAEWREYKNKEQENENHEAEFEQSGNGNKGRDAEQGGGSQ